MSQKNNQNYFCYNYVKLTPNLTIFSTKMALRCIHFPIHLTHINGALHCRVKRSCSKLNVNVIYLFSTIIKHYKAACTKNELDSKAALLHLQLPTN